MNIILHEIEAKNLCFWLVSAPTKAVQCCGYGYDVLRRAALGKPVPKWVAKAIYRALHTNPWGET